MNTVDFTPLYRSSIGFDSLASLLDRTFNTDSVASGYPPYNIEALDDNLYGITLAVAGFEDSELDIQVEQAVLTVRGKKANEDEHEYLYQGIANRSFERKFNLADYVEVKGANLSNGLLSINLEKEIPEIMKPKHIEINPSSNILEHDIGALSEEEVAA